MLTLEDCIAFSGLTGDQVDAVARHRHIPAIVAAEWAECLLATEDGCNAVEAALIEEAVRATAHHRACAGAWCRGLAEFRHAHPH